MSSLHNILIDCGFRYVEARHIDKTKLIVKFYNNRGFYVKSYEVDGDCFQIALGLREDPHVDLPDAYIIQAPTKYDGKLLPHVNWGEYLCYVETMEADWDSNSLRDTYRDVDAQIQRTLTYSIKSAEEGSENDREMRGEFSSYWLPAEEVFFFESRNSESTLVGSCSKSADRNESPSTQWAVYSKQTEGDYRKWLTQRNRYENSELDFSIHTIKVKPNRLAGMAWPPNNFKTVLDWLKSVDRQAYDRSLDKLSRMRKSRHLFLFDINEQDMIGLVIKVNPDVFNIRACKHKKPINRQKLKSLLSNPIAVPTFLRLEVVMVDRKTILSRNRPRPELGDLSSKNVAVIGCGTIGSHLASLLLRAGAGCGKARLDLYDADTLMPHNYSRHALHTSDFLKNKAQATATNLYSSSHLAKSITGFNHQFPINRKQLSQYDIILDATGRPPVSKRLAKVTRTISENNRPIIIHGFNDGNGRAAKVVIDNGYACYSCLLLDLNLYENQVDRRFKGIDTESEKRVSCGATYTPYDAAVSVITAAMMQDAALQTLEDDYSWTYSEHMLDGNQSERPKIFSPQKDCRVCNGG